MVVEGPVCKIKLDERNAKYNSGYKDRIYYFRGLSAKKRFDDSPKKYIIESFFENLFSNCYWSAQCGRIEFAKRR
jgi:YHS domain-containing protein